MKQGFAGLKRAFITGLLVVLPLGITLWVLIRVASFMDGMLDVLPAWAHPEMLLGVRLPGLGILLTLVLVLSVGAGMRYYAISSVVEAYERLLAKVPVASGIYQGFKQLFNTLFSQQGMHFRQVVLVEYPRRGAWAIAFVTGDVGFLTSGSVAPDALVSVFLPTTPNPTSGFYLVVPAADLRGLDVTVEEAFKLIMSAGIVQPDTPRAVSAVTLEAPRVDTAEAG
ncbi:MAG: DUF502 domain-containing protein [Alphaproteobacteria bacterium]|nr:DUF502 domain-containing protein [Alphaproteobacteria bacterium]